MFLVGLGHALPADLYRFAELSYKVQRCCMQVHCVVTLLLDSGRSGCQVQNTSKLVFVELASAYMDEEDGRFVKGGGIADAVRALSQGGALPAAFGSKRAHVLEQYLKVVL